MLGVTILWGGVALADTAQTSIVVRGNCNVAIGVNMGNVTFTGCDDPDSEDFRRRFLAWFSTTQYARSLHEIQQQREEIDRLAAGANLLQGSQEASSEQVENLSHDVHRLKADQIRDRAQLLEETRALADSAHQEFAEAVVDEHAAFQTLNEQVLDNILRTSSLNDQLADIETRLDKLQNDVQYVMREFLEGRLERTLVFAGASVGALINGGQLNPRYEVAAEWLSPSFKRVVVLTELGRTDWTLRDHYETFPGLPRESFDINRTQTYFSLGLLYLSSWETHGMRLEVGSALGRSGGEGNSGVTASMLLRGEWTLRSLLVSLDVREDYFAQVPTQSRAFNPLGNAIVHDGTAGQGVPSIELRFATRIL